MKNTIIKEEYGDIIVYMAEYAMDDMNLEKARTDKERDLINRFSCLRNKILLCEQSIFVLNQDLSITLRQLIDICLSDSSDIVLTDDEKKKVFWLRDNI